MIIGNYTSKLTSSRRVAIPKKIREKLGNRFIIARWYENCLVAVSTDAWQELLNKLTGKSDIFTSPVRDTDRFILGSAYEVNTDSQGRALLPESLVKFAGLTDDVVFVGLGERVELWNKASWQKHEEFIQKNASQLVENLAKEKKNA